MKSGRSGSNDRRREAATPSDRFWDHGSGEQNNGKILPATVEVEATSISTATAKAQANSRRARQISSGLPSRPPSTRKTPYLFP